MATNITELERLADLSQEERKELEVLASSEAQGDAGRAVLRRAAEIRATAAADAVDLLRTAAATVTDAHVRTLREARVALDAAENAERALAHGAFSGLPVAGTGEDAWRNLWEAARAFSLVGGHAHPSGVGEHCLLCQQPVDVATAARLTRFEDFVRGEQRAKALEARRRLDALVGQLPSEVLLRTQVEARLGQLSDGGAVNSAREALEATIARLSEARNIAQGRTVSVTPCSGGLESLEAEAEAATAEIQSLMIHDDPEERDRTAARLIELRGRAALAAALPMCRDRVAAVRRSRALEEAARQLSTGAVTKLVSSLAEEAITDRLRDQVDRELEGLNPVASRVKVKPKPAKGQPVVQLGFEEPCHAGVGDVLSEGEQRALALAFFLAEITVREDGSAIVLDDPISSLDHDRRRWVAKRLVEEAKRRQVIVVTHDLAFLHFLSEAAEREEIDLHGQRVQRYNGRVGIVTADLPNDAAAPAKRCKALRHELRTVLEPMHRNDDPAYEVRVQTWLLDLRRGYEYVIEEFLLRGVIRRTSAHVRTSQLPHVRPEPALVVRVLRGVKDSSEDAHHEPPELQAPPFTPSELRKLLDEFESVCDEANPQVKKLPLRSVPNGIDEAGAA